MKIRPYLFLIAALLLLLVGAACAQSEAQGPTTELGVVYRSPT